MSTSSVVMWPLQLDMLYSMGGLKKHGKIFAIMYLCDDAFFAKEFAVKLDVILFIPYALIIAALGSTVYGIRCHIDIHCAGGHMDVIDMP